MADRIHSKVEFRGIGDGRLVTLCDGSVEAGGVAVGNTLKIPLEDWGEDHGAELFGRAFVAFNLLSGSLEHLSRIALTAKCFVAAVVITVSILSEGLVNELDVNGG